MNIFALMLWGAAGLALVAGMPAPAIPVVLFADAAAKAAALTLRRNP